MFHCTADNKPVAADRPVTFCPDTLTAFRLRASGVRLQTSPHPILVFARSLALAIAFGRYCPPDRVCLFGLAIWRLPCVRPTSTSAAPSASRPTTAPPPLRPLPSPRPRPSQLPAPRQTVMVYITSDIFGPSTTNDWQRNTTSNSWHAMAHEQHAASLGKRKRQTADDGPPTYEPPDMRFEKDRLANSASRNILRQHRSSPSRETTRLHRHNTPPFEPNSSLSYSSFPSKPCEYTSDRRPVKQLKRISPKATLAKSTSHLMDVDLDTPPPCQSQPHPVSDLRSCHACNKAPTRKKDLENYLDCRRCEERTCYICARQCVGCRKSICKKCIVEVGEEGDAWCLDCYARTLNS